MHKLKKEELKLLNKSLSEELLNLNELYSNLKYTFNFDDELLYNISDNTDEIFSSCKLLSSAIEKIIISSTNDEFRQQCSQLLNTTQSGTLNKVIFVKLLGLFNNNSNYDFQNKR
ncbi:GSCOCG00003209001-RA-CDS [Cotesia congregata]|nr:GSCOCG00003209001-RA-CDS [Cotesia congregata]